MMCYTGETIWLRLSHTLIKANYTFLKKELKNIIIAQLSGDFTGALLVGLAQAELWDR